MPEQRKKGKKKTGFFFTEEEKRILKLTADKAGLDMSALVKQLIQEKAKELGLK